MNASESDSNSLKTGDTLKCSKCEFVLKIVNECNCDQGAPKLSCCGLPLVSDSDS